jgi:soluble lytic murein transglycosylase
VKLYPRNGSTQAILWYRAWQHEEQEDYRGALRRYRRIYRGYRRGKRGDDSYFRAGLIHYKLEHFDSAEASFEGFLDRYPSSSLAQAARYWRGKARLAQLDFDKAKELFTEIVSCDPLDYYAYRSRRMLALIGDTISHPALDSIFDLDYARRWIDSISADRKVSLLPADSSNYRAGVQLAMIGLTDHAVYYLEPLEIRYTTNLLLQFDLTALYRISGDPTLAFRVARRLAWRIPSEHRKAMPLAVHTLLYPSSFGNLIESEAERNGLDPSLISAVIRQESIFDPRIVSPVGAVGLMQIMPYTGEEIARQLNEEFVLDSLRSPRVNIRYGAFYIRQLLDQFDGNLVLALAGYNGGPHNVKKWYATNKGDVFDMFVEDIAFTETRRYVKKVLANFWTYVQLRRLVHGTAEELPFVAPIAPGALQ